MIPSQEKTLGNLPAWADHGLNRTTTMLDQFSAGLGKTRYHEAYAGRSVIIGLPEQILEKRPAK